MTGTSLHDLPRTMAGYVIYDRAANPNGAAVVMNTEHCKNRRSRAERGIFEAFAVPLVAGLLFPFAVCVNVRGSVSSPRVCKNASPDFRRIRI